MKKAVHNTNRRPPSYAVASASMLLLAVACGSDGANTPANSTVPVGAPTTVQTPTTTTPTSTTPSNPSPSGPIGTPAAVGAAGASAPSAGLAGSGAVPGAIGGQPSTPMNAAGAPAMAIAGSPAIGGVAGAPSMPGDADIEQCYELRAHGQPTPGDKTKYSVGTGETYTSFIFKAPWTKPVQGLRFRHLADNAAVLHHWLLYSESASFQDGAIDSCALDGPVGILCGQATSRALITGWAPGRGDFRLPEGVGLELPGPGSLLAVEFHYFNSGSPGAKDGSGVEVCTTSKFRPNTASITWLGTHTIDIPARQMGTASGTCTPLRKGMNGTDPIHVIFSWPHMHKLGTHLKSVVMRAAGGQDVMYDGAFDFNSQQVHESPVMLLPGDRVTTTCTFMNTTDETVLFGQSTTQEMCYNFAYAWPAHALDNPGAEIGGALNNCLH